jgi:sulfur-oxidizing protein SoxY
MASRGPAATNYAGMMKGIKYGLLVIPNDPESSNLLPRLGGDWTSERSLSAPAAHPAWRESASRPGRLRRRLAHSETSTLVTNSPARARNSRSPDVNINLDPFHPRRYDIWGIQNDITSVTALGRRGRVMRTATGLTRRLVLKCSAGLVAPALAVPSLARANEDGLEVISHLTGKVPIPSDRVHLVMPRVFPNGYTVPLTIEIDSPMTDADHVRNVRVVAPRNPIIEVANFHFTPRCGEARVSTRIRLAEPQEVLAAAEMSNGALLVSGAWVEVASNGCA